MFTMLIAYSGTSEMPWSAEEAASARLGNLTPAPIEVKAVVDRPALPSPRMLDDDAKLIARFMIQCRRGAWASRRCAAPSTSGSLRWCDELTPPAAAPNTQAFWAHFEALCQRVGIQLRTTWGLADTMQPLYRSKDAEAVPWLWMHHHCAEICSNTQFEAAMKRFEYQVHSLAKAQGRGAALGIARDRARANFAATADRAAHSLQVLKRAKAALEIQTFDPDDGRTER